MLALHLHLHWESRPKRTDCRGDRVVGGTAMNHPCRLRQAILSPESLPSSSLPCDSSVLTPSFCQSTATKVIHNHILLILRRPYTRLTRSGTSAASFFISFLCYPRTRPPHTAASFTLHSKLDSTSCPFNPPPRIAPGARPGLWDILALPKISKQVYAPPTSSSFSWKAKP